MIDGAEEYRAEPRSVRNAGSQTNIFLVDGDWTSKKSWRVHVTGGNLWTSVSRRRRRHLRKTADQRNRSHLRDMNIASFSIQASLARIAWLESSLDTVPALLSTFVCFSYLLIKIYTLQYAWWLPCTKLQLSLNVHRIRFSLTSSIRVWLSGLRLYLQSGRDKTLHGVIFRSVDVVNVLCAQLTHDLFAIRGMNKNLAIANRSLRSLSSCSYPLYSFECTVPVKWLHHY